MIHVNLRRNVAGILTDFVGFGTSLGFIGFDTLLPLLTFALTGNEALVGLVGTLWIGFWLLPQLAAGRWMAGRPRKKPVMIGDKTVSITELILLSWATSGDFQRQKHFFEIAYGKVPEEMNLIGTLDFNFDAWKKKSQERLKKVQALEE